MKSLHRLSLVLLAIPLVAMLWSFRWVIPFAQPERAQIEAGTLNFMFSYENWVHEAGFARLVLSIIGLPILFVPFRKGEWWALVAICALIFAYEIPVFVFDGIPNLGTWPIFRNLPRPGTDGLAMYNLSRLLVAALSLVGVASAVPGFLRSRKA
jgi:hypothetical protein